MRESSALVRVHDAYFCNRYRLPQLAMEVDWLGTSPLTSEDDLWEARQLAFRLPSDLHKPLAMLERHRLPKAATRALQRAYDDAIALCESLENDTRGTSPLHLVREVAQGVLDVRAARKAATRASEAEELRARMRVVVEDELAGKRQPPSAGAIRLAAPGRTCRSLLTMAVRILPLEHQLRYAEEFRADVAHIPRRQRIPYAFRLVLFAWSLRKVLDETPATAAVGVTRDEKGRY
jgi:hypothetical protein